MRAVGVVSLLALVTACGGVDATDGSEPTSTSTSALTASAPALAAFKTAPFSVSGDKKTRATVTPLPDSPTNQRSGQVLVKLRTPLVNAPTMKAFRGISERTLTDAARSKLSGAARAGVRISRVRSLHAPGRVRRGGQWTERVTPVGEYVIDVEGADQNLEATVQKLAQLPEVEWAEPNYIRKTNAVPNDPHYGLQWHLPEVSAPAAWDVTKGRKHIVVAVIDSGVDYTHPDLAANIWTNVDETPGDGIDNDGNGFVDDVRGWDFDGGDADPQDDYGHGTHVSGIVGAVGNDGYGIAGVAWTSRIMAIRAGNASGGLTDAAIVGAIHYAVDNGADVINMSFSGSESSAAIRDAVRYAAERDVVLVAAAGNEGGLAVSYPAAYPEVIAVAALDPGGQLASYSTFGSFVDVAAPGTDILSTLPGGWGAASGTSMASPVVAGLAALAKSAHPDFNADAIRYQIVSTASDLNAQNPTLATKLGSGKVDASKVVGARSPAPWVSLVEHSVAEASGDFDGEFEPGETLSLTATLAGFADATTVTVSLISSDPWLTPGAPLNVNVPYGSTSATLSLTVNHGVPPNHVAAATLHVESGSLVRTWPISVRLWPTFRTAAELPPTISHSLVNLPGSKMALVYDNLDWRTNGHWRVYGALREENGAFSTPVLLSDPATDAAGVATHAEPNGVVHAVFRQFDENHDNPKLYYVRFEPSTSTWSPAELISAPDDFPNWYSTVAAESIAVDAEGHPHVSWYDFSAPLGRGEVRTAQRTPSGWVRSTHYAAPGFPDGDAGLVLQPNGLLGFFFTLGRYGQQLLAEWDGASWSAARPLGEAPQQFSSKVPFVYDGALRRVQSESWGAPYTLAELDGDVWSPLQVMAPSVTSQVAFTNLAVQQFGPQQFDLWTVQDGVTRFVTFNGVAEIEIPTSLRNPGDYADSPVLARGADGQRHAFAKGYLLHQGGYWNSYTSYITTAPINAALRPSQPIVTDPGASTASPLVPISWSSTSGAPVDFYRVGVGTTPGIDDVVRFSRVNGTSATFDLGHLLEPGRIYYFSVRAVGQGLYESEVGSSDGITYNPVLRCTADPWNPSFVYSDPGTLVTHGGNTYRSLWHNSGVTPTPGGNGPWKLVGSCSGQPALSVCDNPLWSPSTVYQSGEVVNYGGYEFLNLWYSQGQVPTGQNGNAWRVIGACQTN